MNATLIATISHLVIVLALLIVFVLTGDRDALVAAISFAAGGGTVYAATKAAPTT